VVSKKVVPSSHGKQTPKTHARRRQLYVLPHKCGGVGIMSHRPHVLCPNFDHVLYLKRATKLQDCRRIHFLLSSISFGSTGLDLNIDIECNLTILPGTAAELY
jgi:hypothetical protein